MYLTFLTAALLSTAPVHAAPGTADAVTLPTTPHAPKTPWQLTGHKRPTFLRELWRTSLLTAAARITTTPLWPAYTARLDAGGAMPWGYAIGAAISVPLVLAPLNGLVAHRVRHHWMVNNGAPITPTTQRGLRAGQVLMHTGAALWGVGVTWAAAADDRSSPSAADPWSGPGLTASAGLLMSCVGVLILAQVAEIGPWPRRGIPSAADRSPKTGAKG